MNRGYTMHEHLDEFGLINMNGRMYDPKLACFLSPDPYIQAPDLWLNHNRYAYCLGNPLKYTDPTGCYIARSSGGMYDSKEWHNEEDNSGDLALQWCQNGVIYSVYSWDNGKYSLQAGYGNVAAHWLGSFSSAGKTGKSEFDAGFDNSDLTKTLSQFQSGMENSYGTGGYVKSICDYVSNGVGTASAAPTIQSTWKYNGNKLNNGTSWTGKNGKFYRTSTTPKNNICYNNSMNMAKNASKVARTTGNCMTGLAMVASLGSAIYDVSQGTDNTSTWVNLAVGVGTGVITFVAGPAVVTGAAVVGAVWGVSQLVAGDEINGWIDNNFGY